MIVIQGIDVIAVDPEIGEGAEVGIEEIEIDTEIIETIEIAETEMIIEEIEMIEEIETEKDTETVAETDIETGDNLPFGGGHPIYKYCVCFIVAPQQVSLLILSFLTAEKNQGTHFIITFTSKDSSALLSQTQITPK